MCIRDRADSQRLAGVEDLVATIVPTAMPAAAPMMMTPMRALVSNDIPDVPLLSSLSLETSIMAAAPSEGVTFGSRCV